ncbi:MAG: TrkA C-terminal domain-containing protein, partial [Candidatus Aminicenantes bacterium]|nr:TrkA C-terminal domain-containing protein [Candidatus Aminicenantes bacterium]
VVKRKDVIEAYNHEINKRETTAGIVRKIKFSQINQSFDIGGGYRIMETEAPAQFWDKTLMELNLKARYRVDILLIRRKFPPQTINLPPAGEIICKGDILVIAGSEDNLNSALHPPKNSH